MFGIRVRLLASWSVIIRDESGSFSVRILATWAQIRFQNRASPLIEQLIFFHDHALLILILIATLVGYFILSLITNKFFNRYLLDGQIIEIILLHLGWGVTRVYSNVHTLGKSSKRDHTRDNARLFMVGEEQGWILECFRPCCFYEYSWSTKETIRSLQSKVERLSTFALACFPEALEPMLLTRHSDKARSNVLVHSPLLVSKKEMSVGSVSRVCHVISTWQIPPREGGRPDCFYRKIKPTERVPQNQKTLNQKTNHPKI